MAWIRIKDNPEAREKQRVYQREWRRRQRGANVVVKPDGPKATKSEVQRRWRIKSQARDKKAVFDHYGLCCVRCGENDPVVLTIDHIDQKGYKHKLNNQKRRVSGYMLYRWLVKTGFPEGFRTACANCQIRFYRESQQSVDRA